MEENFPRGAMAKKSHYTFTGKNLAFREEDASERRHGWQMWLQNQVLRFAGNVSFASHIQKGYGRHTALEESEEKEKLFLDIIKEARASVPMGYVQNPPASSMHTIRYKIEGKDSACATFELVSRSMVARNAWQELEASYYNDVGFANGLANKSSIQKHCNIIGKWQSIMETLAQKGEAEMITAIDCQLIAAWQLQTPQHQHDGIGEKQ